MNSLPITEIAVAGLPNAAHFSRSVRERYDLGPRELRASHQTIAPVK